MADIEKTTGVPVDEKDLDGVSGGVVSPRDIEPGTVEPLDNETTKIAEEFRQGMNLGNMLGRY